MPLKETDPVEVAHARAAGAHWPDETAPPCEWCAALHLSQSPRPAGSAGGGRGIEERLARVRDVILPVAALTVLAALVWGLVA
ncbi:hypothetical protein [Streptomyces sp. NPDC003719]